MGPVGEERAAGAGGGAAVNGEEEGGESKGSGALGGGSRAYVPPSLRDGAKASAGERMAGKYERDDLATLRVTNVSDGIAQ